MLSRPILKSNIKPFNANDNYDVIFYIDGNMSQIIKNNLIIEKVEDNSIVYNQTIETFSLQHRIPSETLQNGVNYKMKLRVGTINNQWSEFSDYEIFWCFSKPTINIPTIDYNNQNKVYNQTVDFQATYTQNENEPLQSYKYLLYNNNKDLIQSFPEKFYNNEEFLTQEIAGLENSVLYYVEVKTISIHGNEGSSGLIWFKPFYVAPKLSLAITPENIKEEGAIKISANILQFIGKLYDSEGEQIPLLEIEYIDNEWLDLTRTDYHKLVFDDGFDLDQSDFVFQIWFKNLINSESIVKRKVFMTLHSPYGKIEFYRQNNEIHGLKISYYHSLMSHFTSNQLDLLDGQEYMLYIKSVNNMLDLEVKPYTEVGE